jgi:hypothetical protein
MSNSMQTQLWSSWCTNVWKQRAGVKHGNLLKTQERIAKQTTWEIRSRIMSRGKFSLTRDKVELCNRWKLPENLLKE